MNCEILTTSLCLEVLHSNDFNSVKIEMYLLVPHFCIFGEVRCFLLYILISVGVFKYLLSVVVLNLLFLGWVFFFGKYSAVML